MAHAKAIFFGEHALVYGKKGISIPLNQMKINVKLNKTDTTQERDEIIDYIAKECGISNTTEIKITSSIPLGRGLGSSAALSVAIARANSCKNIKEIADKCEKFIHGNPSGIDVSQVLSDKPLLFSKEEGAQELDFTLDAYLLIIDTGIVGITKHAVERVRKNYEQNKRAIEELGNISLEVIEPLKNKDIEKVASYMNKAHILLNELSVCHPANNEVVEISKKNGAIGAKLTGGGDGGCCIALTPEQNTAKKIQKKLKEKGYSSWIVTL
ncbi:MULTISPECIES: mevalonate kinase [unclassified Gemella]|uniref:mevalonate kinase n=1 Tax=unclassified Gemella TaxID=2624949 RepID=UPI00107393D9|nr:MULTISPECIES: mevalonate kinase [unclassified Gemella]MBF0709799.1 mevalonate kinase [Gemella sp. GL1.1]MBF0747113.1 mevalonate kinase [Gemella sp. 19428wG2_WT2a]NYS27143.1 mevalonate kinase [Gemella sp. GL1]TFU58356.1 mevalonate kinase [Gemella sp. WT2a]